MRILPFVLAAVAAGGLAVDARQRPAGPPVLKAPEGTGAISGVVTDAVTSRPLEGAMVSLGITTGGPVLLTLPRAVTDSKGRFLFRDLAPSTKYYMSVARLGYAPGRFGTSGPAIPSDRLADQIRTTDDVVTINLAADQWIGDLQIPMWRLGSISGRVLDERGEPVVGVAVRGFSTVWIAGHTQMVGSDVGTTDDRGEYRLVNLMPGQYAVSVLSVQSTVLNSTPEANPRRAVGELARVSGGGPNPGMPAVDVDGTHRLAVTNFAVPPPPSSTSPRAYAAQFYPNASTLTNAQFLDLTNGASRLGVDFRLQPVPAVTVSGRVEGPGDASSALLRLMPRGSEMLGVGSETATTVVERGGSFTFLNVPAGEYTLLAQAVFGEVTSGNGEVSLADAPGFSPGAGQVAMGGLSNLSYSSHTAKTRMWGRASVAVGTSDVINLVVPLHPAVAIRGRIVVTGSRSPLSAIVGVQPANGDPSLGRIATYLDVNGEAPFSLEGLGDGTYLVSVPSLSISVVSVTVAGREVRDTGIDTSAGTDVDDVVITLTTTGASIQGVVRGKASSGATVIAFPIDRARWVDYGIDPVLIRSKAADNDGVFLMKGLPQGEYFAIAVDRAFHDAWKDPKFLEAAAPLATRVSLTSGDKKSVDLQLSKVVVK